MAMPGPRTGGQIVVDALLAQGVDTIFQVPGESFTPVLDALLDAGNRIRVITCRHEASAANMADAYGKLTGRPGVVIVTRTPGAAHAAVGVTTARQDSTPMVLLVGQAETGILGREAFQEFDAAGMFGWTAKWTGEAKTASELPGLLGDAFTASQTGRMGPSILSLPRDVLGATTDAEDPPRADPKPGKPSAAEMEQLGELLAAAKRPLMIFGGSGWTHEATIALTNFTEKYSLPAAASFRRMDRHDNRHSSYVGDLNFAPDPQLVIRAREADLILALGTRLGEIPTQTYTLMKSPRPDQTLVHIYPDASELGRVFEPDLGIVATPVTFLEVADILPEINNPVWAEWASELRREYEATLLPVPCPGDVDMNEVIKIVRETLPGDAIITLDAGNFSQWPQRFIPFTSYPSLLGPASGAMGYGVPSGIAAKCVFPDRPVVTFVGDGGFLMSGSELATAMQYGLSPVILVFNNGIFGTIRAHQERQYPGRVSGTEITNPDFAAYAESFGAFGARVAKTSEFKPAFDAALNAGRAAVLDIKLDPEAISTRATLSGIREAALKRGDWGIAAADYGRTWPSTENLTESPNRA